MVRALEIYHSGTKKSDIVDELVPKYDYLAYSIAFDREILYTRINNRVDEMLKNGLVEEVKNLLKCGVSKQNQCMQAIGYKEIVDYLNGNCSLDKAIDDIKLNTRHYAKRQITYFKKLNVKMLEPQSVEQMAKDIASEFEGK